MVLSTFFIVLLAATAISVAIVIPKNRREEISAGAVRSFEIYKRGLGSRGAPGYHREKRQNSDECDTAQANLYEHEHGDDCMQIFYDHEQPFFDRDLWTDDFANQFCNEWSCGDFVPTGLNDIITDCGFDVRNT